MKDQTKTEYPEFNYVYDSLEDFYDSSLSQGFEIRDIVQLSFQLISIKIFEIADSNEQALSVIMTLSKTIAEKFDVGELLEAQQLPFNDKDRKIH